MFLPTTIGGASIEWVNQDRKGCLQNKFVNIVLPFSGLKSLDFANLSAILSAILNSMLLVFISTGF